MEMIRVIEHVAKSYNLSPDTLKSAKKHPYIVEPKFVAIYILSEIFNIKKTDIIQILDTNHDKIRHAIKRMKVKFEDADFKYFFDKLMNGFKNNTPVPDLSRQRDLVEFKSWCKEEGMCLVAPYLKIPSYSLAMKYSVTTAPRLYFVLTTGYYPDRSGWIRMHPNCKTKNCVTHWIGEREDEFTEVQTEANEEPDVVRPEEKLIYAIIQSAIDEKDERYFKSGLFFEDLDILGIENRNKILKFLPNWSI